MRSMMAIVFLLVTLPFVGGHAMAAACDSAVVTDTGASSGLNGFLVDGNEASNSDCETVDGGSSDADPIRDSDLDAICVQTAITEGRDPFDFCDLQDDGVELSASTVAAVLRVIPLPGSKLLVQPPNGLTLVNFDTNFFTDAQPLDRTVTLLGQRVDLHIVPSEFGWRFGDSESLATAEPGAPYPDLEVTHRYLKKGHVAPSVDTTYRATYRVNGGRWIKVRGSVTIAGAPVDLQVLTATPTLVGYDRASFLGGGPA